MYATILTVAPTMVWSIPAGHLEKPAGAFTAKESPAPFQQKTDTP